MEICAVLLFFVVCLIVFDLLYGFIGLILCRFTNYNRLGCRLIAMSFFLCKYTPVYCSMSCTSSNCGNWTCPNYYFPIDK